MHCRNINEGRRLKNRLGKRLRELRESVGLSHAEMVRRLQNGGWEIDPATYTRMELGQRTLTDLEVFECLRVLGKKWGALDG
ncbi:MAG: helix-turn-helix transcriptional regulator [Verrucomicrobiae bacterium]